MKIKQYATALLTFASLNAFSAINEKTDLTYTSSSNVMNVVNVDDSSRNAKLSIQPGNENYIESTNVYPSPAINSISVEGILSEVELSVYNSLGEKVLFF